MKVLFMCTHNSCRSILSEAVFNHFCGPAFQAVSSGSQPSGRVNPQALASLSAAGFATEGLSSKGSEAFADDAPDIVITVCDNAAGEACPLFLGKAIRVHWGLPDPSALQADEAQVEEAFQWVLGKIIERVQAFLAVPVKDLTPEQLQVELARIGQL